MEKTKISIFVMDVDGTLTDGKIHIGLLGEAHKSFCVKDGMGIKLLQRQGVITVILTARSSMIVENRARELAITELYQSVSDKLQIISALSKKYNVPLENIAYIGDDINDIEVMKHVGRSFCPSDSVPDVRGVADTILTKKGGDGAVREAVEIILNS